MKRRGTLSRGNVGVTKSDELTGTHVEGMNTTPSRHLLMSTLRTWSMGLCKSLQQRVTLSRANVRTCDDDMKRRAMLSRGNVGVTKSEKSTGTHEEGTSTTLFRHGLTSTFRTSGANPCNGK
jgi:hypothetical protein